MIFIVLALNVVLPEDNGCEDVRGILVHGYEKTFHGATGVVSSHVSRKRRRR